MILAITQARMGSSRFPQKILKISCYGKSLLQHHIERLKKSKLIDEFCLATTQEEGADAIVDVARKTNIPFYQGSTNDVLDRFYQAVQSQKSRPEYIVRVTSDCPLIDSHIIDDVVEAMKKYACDYASNTIFPTFPDGQDVEVFTYKSLGTAWKEAKTTYQREHVTPYIYENSNLKNGNLFSAINVKNSEDYSSFRLTLDYLEDYTLINQLFEQCGENISWFGCVEFMKRHPELGKANIMHKRNKSLL